MPIKLPFKFDAKTLTLIVSLLLNLLGGTSTIEPLIGAEEPSCPPLLPAPPLEASPIISPTLTPLPA